MPTVIDSLVVTLGLDTKQLTAGIQQATTALDTLRKNAGQIDLRLKQTSEVSRKTAQDIASHGKIAGEAFGMIRNKALGLLTALIGGKGLEATVRDTATSLADLGRRASNIGVSAPRLAEFRNAIEANGGSAEAAAASFQRLSDSMSQLRLTGSTSQSVMSALNAIGAHRGDDAMQVLQRLASFADAHPGNTGLVRQLGMGLGLDEGSINEALRGRVQLEKDLADSRARGQPTADMIKRMQELQGAWIKLGQAAQHLKDVFVDQFGPALTSILDAITAFIKDQPGWATALGIAGAVAGTAAAGWVGSRLLGGIVGRGVAGAVGGSLGGLAGGASLEAAAAALIGAAEALTAAAAALGGSGVAGAAGAAGKGIAGAAGAAGRGLRADAGYMTSSAAPGLLSRVGGLIARVAPYAAGVGGVVAGLSVGKKGGMFGSIPADEFAATGQPRPAGATSGSAAKAIGLTSAEYDAFSRSVGGIESRGQYNIMGGSSGRFAGKYQLGAAEIAETARQLGVPVPSREEFLSNPAMQERFFEQYTLSHHNWLMRHNQKYAAMSPAERAGVLGYAHNQGAGGASRWLDTGQVGRDAFGTAGTRYTENITSAIRAVRSGDATGRTQMAQAGAGQQVVHVNGPITINTQATDAKGVARSLRAELAGRQLTRQANTGLA